jgi:hypothetical protein
MSNVIYLCIITLTLIQYSAAQPCASTPCQNGGGCVTQSNSTTYACICPNVYTGNQCQTTNCYYRYLYSCGNQNPSNWYQTDPFTGVGTLIGSMVNIDDCQAVAQDPITKIIYAAGTDSGSGNPAFYSVVRTTGVATFIGFLGLGAGESILDMAFHPTTNILYFESGTRLYTVNRNTGAATLIGNSNLFDSGAMVFINGILYSVTNSPMNLVTINLGTGAATVIAPLTGPGVDNCILDFERISAFALYGSVILGWFGCQTNAHDQLIHIDIPSGIVQNVGPQLFPGFLFTSLATVQVPFDCQNGGNCNNNVSCVCPPGVSGMFCETNTPECASEPCQNGGTCLDGFSSFTCLCASGYSGLICETEINECASDPCQNGGTCIDGVNSFTCNCLSNYFGSLCELFDACASNPCQNGGTCSNNPATALFNCTCVSGFSGTLCQNNIDDCASNPCQHSESSLCVDDVESYHCICGTNIIGNTCGTPNCVNHTMYSCDRFANWYLTVPGQPIQLISSLEPTLTICEAVAQSPINSLVYVVGKNSTGDSLLITVNPLTGTIINIIGTTGVIEGFGDITFHPNTGILYAIESTGQQVYTLNLNTGESTSLPNPTGQTGNGNGLVFSNNQLYWTAGDDIRLIDSNSGSSVLLTTMSGLPDPCTKPQFTALTSYPSLILGWFSCAFFDTPVSGNPNSTLTMLNLATGQITFISNITVFQMDGISEVVFPFPTTCESNQQCINATCLEINACIPNPCQNGATCVNGTCTCILGYTGTTCETEIDECASNPCLNGGICIDSLNGFTCVCAPGTIQPICTPCGPGSFSISGSQLSCTPCEPGAINSLFGQTNCTNCTANTFNPNFSGTSCNTCGNNQFSGSGATQCLPCPPGFTGVGCITDIDECASTPCANGGTCVDFVNAFNCTCPHPFSGTNCQDGGVCFNNPCQNSGTCTPCP